jgi:hypothetical protein
VGEAREQQPHRQRDQQHQRQRDHAAEVAGHGRARADRRGGDHQRCERAQHLPGA